MAEKLSANQVARDHGLNDEQTLELHKLVVADLMIRTAGNLTESVVDSDKLQETLDQLMETASVPVLEALEDYLRRDLSERGVPATA